VVSKLRVIAQELSQPQPPQHTHVVTDTASHAALVDDMAEAIEAEESFHQEAAE
jgi:hypothetical protein